MTFTNKTVFSTNKIRIAYSGIDFVTAIQDNLSNKFQIFSSTTTEQFNAYLSQLSLSSLPEIILIEADELDNCFVLIENIRKSALLRGLIIVLLASQPTSSCLQKARQFKIHDFYIHPFSYDELAERLEFLVRFKLIKPSIVNLSEKVSATYNIPAGKRAFDLALSLTCILLLSPLFVIIAGLIFIESDGKIIYKSKRVGTGYNVFDFYKFRSMRSNADEYLIDLSNLNQYLETTANTTSPTFVKLKNDPRVTRLGAFLRKTSMDELPQLFNIVKGDMSLVGNRPLPLYEAEKLTSNEWSTRFLGPAGLTGLWQISKRGQSEMSELERKKLDNYYALNYSFWFDLKIILGTFPALFQKENV